MVFHDALVHPQTLALAARAERFSWAKRSGRHSTAQSFINKRLVDAARKHGVVVRLKGGDPMLFGRAQEENRRPAQAGIDFETVPGVTAATAASAELGVSLTRRGLAAMSPSSRPRAGRGERVERLGGERARCRHRSHLHGRGLAEGISTELIARGKAKATPLRPGGKRDASGAGASSAERWQICPRWRFRPAVARGAAPRRSAEDAIADRAAVAIPEIQGLSQAGLSRRRRTRFSCGVRFEVFVSRVPL